MIKKASNRLVCRPSFGKLCKSLLLWFRTKVCNIASKAAVPPVKLSHNLPNRTNLGVTTFDIHSDSTKPLILGYLPNEFCGWILEYLFRDIASFAGRVSFLLIKSPDDLSSHFYSSNRAFVFSLHPSFVGPILDLGIPPQSVISFYTHSRLGMSISSLGRLKALLPMNSTEAAALFLSNIDPKIIRVFPAGYDPTLFCLTSSVGAEWHQRTIDVLFVCRYEHASNNHYFLRKAYPLLISLGKALALKGYKVLVLGKGWEHCPDDYFKNVVQVTAIDHHNYPEVYQNSKLLVTPSLQEGGPVSWLEAMACGCLTLSTSSGFPAELRSGQLGSYLMPLRASVQEWVAEITKILELPEVVQVIDMAGRNHFLHPARFTELAKIIEDIALNDALPNPSLLWP